MVDKIINITGTGFQVVVNGTTIYPTVTQGPYTSIPAPRGTIVNCAPGDDIQAKLNSVPSGGTLVFAAGNYSGTAYITGKDGVMLWADGVCNLSLTFDFRNINDWVIKGRAPGEGFSFAGPGFIYAENSINYIIGNCEFHGQGPIGDVSSCIACSGATNGLVINCDFNQWYGGAIGHYTMHGLTIEGCHFTGFTGDIGHEMFDCGSSSEDIVFRRCWYQNIGRTGIEVTGDSVIRNFVIDNCWFKGYQFPAVPSTAAPISQVGVNTTGGQITNNYIRRGSSNTHYAEGIELASQNVPHLVTGNLLCDLDSPFAMYGLDATAPNNFGNQVYNCGGNLFGNTVLTSDPGDPPKPTRVAW